MGTVGILPHADGQARLRWILVHPAARGQGLALRLMNAAIAFAREYGYRQIHLQHVAPDSPAIHLYESLGFRPVGSSPQSRWGQDFVGTDYILDLAE